MIEYHQRCTVIWSVLVILNLFALLYMSVYFLENLFQFSNVTLSSVVLLVTHMIILLFLVAFAVYDRRVLYKKRLAIQTERILAQIEKQQIYQTRLQEKTTLAQKEKAEFERHIANIAIMADDEKTAEIASYIEALKPVKNIGTVQRITGTATLDLMFCEKLQVADRKQVALHIDYQPDVRVHKLSEYDMNILLSNLLDNALESAAHSKERKVSCEVCRKTQYMDLIVVQNSCDEKPMMKHGLPVAYSSTEEHGYGTKIIQKKVQQYNGNLQYGYNAQDKQLSATILLPCKMIRNEGR